MTKRGIIIANTGSPTAPTSEAVRSYLSEFLTGPRIRPMNPFFWNIILKMFILPRRSEVSAQKYRLLWTDEGSPLVVYMCSLAAKLQRLFDGDDGETLVRCAMSYGSPSLLEAFVELKQENCEELTVIPLYPQSAYSTTKVVEDKTYEALSELHWKPALHFIESYSGRDEYRSAIAQTIKDADFNPDEDALLMAFHSIPMKDINAGDKYAKLVYESADAIAGLLGVSDDAWQIGFQCRFDKSRKWLGPTIDEALQRFNSIDGRLFVVAPNFSIDCLETLFDIELVFKQKYLQSRPELDDSDFVYVPCLNDSNMHVELLKAIVITLAL